MKNKRKSKRRIYLDYAASTPIDARVSKMMQEIEKVAWGNASSLHQEGELAKAILKEARTSVARILHCKKEEIFFTSGGTEGCNIAILGIVESARVKGIFPHIIVSAIEHPAVLEPVKNLLEKRMAEVSFLSPNEKGIIDTQAVEKELKKNTVLVSVMHANNEIGAIQPIRKISSLIRHWRSKTSSLYPYLLTDASQSVCYHDVSLERLGADVSILDGVKMYGPRAAGILAVKRHVGIKPIIFGGGQESGLRSGTEDAIAAAGLAEALRICEKTREKEEARLRKLRDYAITKILKEISNTSLNGSLEFRLPNNINICFPKNDSEFLVIKLDTLGFAVSAASACNNLSLENSSYVIKSLGKEECATSSLRFTLGRTTRKSDLDALISALKKIIK